MDWLLELEPVWEVPVTAAMIYKATPGYTKYAAMTALKELTASEVLYATIVNGDVATYLPVRLRPVCWAQEFICGRLK